MNLSLEARAAVRFLMLVMMLAAAAIAGCGGAGGDEPESIGKSHQALACFNPSSTARISIGPQDTQANAGSEQPSISGNGRFIAFFSDASNLVTGDSNSLRDVFVRDLVAGQTSLVSVSSSGAQGDRGSAEPSINSDG